jgi:hypothetical protein
MGNMMMMMIIPLLGLHGVRQLLGTPETPARRQAATW